jgi:hypothetical protein
VPWATGFAGVAPKPVAPADTTVTLLEITVGVQFAVTVTALAGIEKVAAIALVAFNMLKPGDVQFTKV